ncbi:unnamed protein product [Prunus armeniaca]
MGSLMYLTTIRPDMKFVVSLISRYMSNPTELHMEAAKRILRYLRGTTDFGVFYKKGGKGELNVYTDSDYAGDQEDRKSTSGYVFLFSSGAVSWSSKKQPIVTLSTTEAEFITAASCACQVVWLRRIFEMLGEKQDRPTIVHCDSSSAIKLAKNPVMHERSKHIDIRFHFLRDLIKAGTVEMVHCNSQEQIADVMTKPLKLDAFVKLKALVSNRGSLLFTPQVPIRPAPNPKVPELGSEPWFLHLPMRVTRPPHPHSLQALQERPTPRRGRCREHHRRQRIDQAFELLRLMALKGLELNLISYNVVINGLCREGRMNETSQVL